MPLTAKAVTFYAKGALGGEQVTFTAQGATEMPITLTATWTKYTLPLTGASKPSLGFSSLACGLEPELSADGQ